MNLCTAAGVSCSGSTVTAMIRTPPAFVPRRWAASLIVSAITGQISGQLV
jgi:hypothetical protein